MIVKSFLANMLPDGSIRNVAILTSGTTLAQSISILAAPILTRLYTPDAFGLVAIYTALLAIFSSISSFRYDMAIPLPEDNDNAAALVALSLICVFGVASISTIILLFWGEVIINKLNAAALMPYLWLFPVGVLLGGSYQVFNFWNIRNKCFTTLAQTKVIQSISGVSVQLLGYGLGPVALLLGRVASQATGLTQLAIAAHQYRGNLFKGISFKQIRTQAHRYKRFPLYSTWGGFFNVTGSQLPPILFAVLFSPAVAGLYALTNRVLAMPMALLGQAIGEVFFSKAAEAKRDGKIGHLVSNVHNKLAQFAMPPTLFLIFVAPELFSFIFGQEWRQAGVFLQLLTPMLYFQFILSPISQTLSVMERQELVMILQGAMLLLRVIALILGALFEDVLLAVGLFSFATSIAYALFLIVTMHVTDVTWAEIIRPTVIAFGWGFIAVVPLILADFLQVNNQSWLLLLSLISLMIVATRCLMVIANNKTFKL